MKNNITIYSKEIKLISCFRMKSFKMEQCHVATGVLLRVVVHSVRSFLNHY